MTAKLLPDTVTVFIISIVETNASRMVETICSLHPAIKIRPFVGI